MPTAFIREIRKIIDLIYFNGKKFHSLVVEPETPVAMTTSTTSYHSLQPQINEQNKNAPPLFKKKTAFV
jgi:hypothetical protein